MSTTTTSTSTSTSPTTTSIDISNYEYSVNTDNTINITKYNIPVVGSNILTIPTIINNKEVSSLGNYSFSGINYITQVIIPSSVTTIGVGAFSFCSNLKYMTIDIDNCKLSKINSNAFRNTNINNVIIPASVTLIDGDAFNVNKLKDVSFLGNSPLFKSDSFVTQTINNNLNNLIYLYYYKNKTGFENPNTNNYHLIPLDEMIISDEMQQLINDFTRSDNTETFETTEITCKKTSSEQKLVIYIIIPLIIFLLFYLINKNKLFNKMI
jgi:hypothetical protein